MSDDELLRAGREGDPVRALVELDRRGLLNRGRTIVEAASRVRRASWRLRACRAGWVRAGGRTYAFTDPRVVARDLARSFSVRHRLLAQRLNEDRQAKRIADEVEARTGIRVDWRVGRHAIPSAAGALYPGPQARDTGAPGA